MNTKLFLACVLFVGLVASSAQAARSTFTPTGTVISELHYTISSGGWGIQTGTGAFLGGGGTSYSPVSATDSLYYPSTTGISTYTININDDFTLSAAVAGATNAALAIGNNTANSSTHATYTINVATGKILTLNPTLNSVGALELLGGANLTINGNVSIYRNATVTNATSFITNPGAGNLIFNGTLHNPKPVNFASNLQFLNASSGNTDIAVLTGDGSISIGVTGGSPATGATILRDTTNYTGTIQFQPYGNLVLATSGVSNVVFNTNNNTSFSTSLRLGNGVTCSTAQNLLASNAAGADPIVKTLGAWGTGATALAPTIATFTGAVSLGNGGSGITKLNLDAPAHTTFNINGNITGGINANGISITGAGKVIISSTVAANTLTIANSTFSIANNSTLALNGAASLLAPSMTFNVANTMAAQLDVSTATAFAWTGALNLSLVNITWTDSDDKEWQLFSGLGGIRTLSLSALTANDMGNLVFTQNGNHWTATDYMDRDWTFDQSNGKLYLGTIPEPASLVLLGLGLGMVALLRRKKLS